VWTKGWRTIVKVCREEGWVAARGLVLGQSELSVVLASFVVNVMLGRRVSRSGLVSTMCGWSWSWSSSWSRSRRRQLQAAPIGHVCMRNNRG
jgi:hypothetical protein